MSISREIVLSQWQQGRMFNIINGGGGGKNKGQLVAVVSGSDLKFVLDEANRQNNNSY